MSGIHRRILISIKPSSSYIFLPLLEYLYNNPEKEREGKKR
jgi:hypothetical protein